MCYQAHTHLPVTFPYADVKREEEKKENFMEKGERGMGKTAKMCNHGSLNTISRKGGEEGKENILCGEGKRRKGKDRVSGKPCPKAHFFCLFWKCIQVVPNMA